MKLGAEERSRVCLRHFRGGHMFYTVERSRAGFRDTARDLVRTATGAG
jgi:hypothetical protein